MNVAQWVRKQLGFEEPKVDARFTHGTIYAAVTKKCPCDLCILKLADHREYQLDVQKRYRQRLKARKKGEANK